MTFVFWHITPKRNSRYDNVVHHAKRKNKLLNIDFMPKEGIDKIFSTREDFAILGVTGRTGSGCSTLSKLLTTEIDNINFPSPEQELDSNNKRRYKITYNFIQKNWKPFYWIKVKDIITSYILEHNLIDILSYLKIHFDLANEIVVDKTIEDNFNLLKERNTKINLTIEKLEHSLKIEISEIVEYYDFYFKSVSQLTEDLKKVFNVSNVSNLNYSSVYQLFGDNIRSSGSILDSNYNFDKIYSISEKINQVIKLIRKKASIDGLKAFIVIDAFRNPFEVHFFRERYSAFYLISVSTENDSRLKRLRAVYDYKDSEIERLDSKESPTKLKGHKYYISQNLSKCIEVADLHFYNPQSVYGGDYKELKQQIVQYISLILHPGLINPTAIERVMQVAFTAKLNSGCISRQVGAAVTDENFSIKSIGWNNTAAGQTPCLLRNISDLYNINDTKAYSDYELKNERFRNELKLIYDDARQRNKDNKIIKGRNISYCFKDIQNCVDSQKNQVYTRSLHAEENAFLQISKYGGQGINGGNLFTTASPCDLCAKKAYQLGIKNIYYIDPYPGISKDNILECGINRPQMHLFSGAIGRAYFHLYLPLLPYKDELAELLDITIPEKVISMSSYLELKNEKELLEKELKELKEKK